MFEIFQTSIATKNYWTLTFSIFSNSNLTESTKNAWQCSFEVHIKTKLGTQNSVCKEVF